MAIVIDVNVFSCVFDVTNENHADFAPIKSWIERREGLLIYGGTKFKCELLQSHRRVRLIRMLRDSGQAVEISSIVVDTLESEVKKKVAGSKCNDPHIIALLAAAKCTLLCSRDKESFLFIKNRSLYPKGTPKVRIYSSIRNVSLLGKKCTRNAIANIV
jgi:predicted nucleic acid-binding protein